MCMQGVCVSGRLHELSTLTRLTALHVSTTDCQLASGSLPGLCNLQQLRRLHLHVQEKAVRLPECLQCRRLQHAAAEQAHSCKVCICCLGNCRRGFSGPVCYWLLSGLRCCKAEHNLAKTTHRMHADICDEP